MMDVVYPIKFGNWNPELRHSLRSLKNIPHRNVVLAGFVPEWAQDVIGIPVKQQRSKKFENTTKILLEVCKDERVSDDFILFNDDFFIVKPIESIPTLHRGPLVNYINNEVIKKEVNRYTRGMKEAYSILRHMGFKNPMNYDIHTPMVINKKNMLEILKDLDMAHSHKRTLYGNIYNVGGVFRDDVKIYDNNSPWDKEYPLVSTIDDAFMRWDIGKYLKKIFKERSVYERY